MIKVTILGTAGSSPAKDRGMPSVALTYEGETLLFDCGEGTQMQLLKFGVNPSKIRAIFLSHIHGDHVIGIAGLVRTMALNSRQDGLKIFVPAGSERAVKSLLSFDKAIISYEIQVIGMTRGEIYKAKDYSIRAFSLEHTIPTYGFVFKEKDKKKFIIEKCKKLGMKGMMFSELQQKGSITINGKKVSIDSVTTVSPGRKIVYVTDTRPARQTVTNAKNADLIIHEASYMDSERDLASSRKHSTAKEAAQIAKRAGARKLVLTHISARYKDPQALLNDTKQIFPNTIVAKDGYHIFI